MPTQRAQGFTLIELVTVLLLISILAVVAINQWPGSSINLSAQADQLANDIRYTQSLAMNRGQRYRINLAADRYWISDAGGTVTISLPGSGATVVTLNSGITLSASYSFLVFDGNGAPYITATTPGTALAADAVITLSADGVSRTLTISPQTGRVLKT
jgi:MSHA pilin protein MshC